VAAYKATNVLAWNTEYEILGDDLVIFNEDIANEYLELMTLLGCEINLNKSISSPKRPVFEFAKRTCLNGQIVSGISLVQLRAGWNVAGRVANVLNFNNSGLITKTSLLAVALSRYPFSNGKFTVSNIQTNERTQKMFSLGILSLFGVYFQKGILPLKTLMTALVNPHYEDADYSGEAVGLPTKASLNVAFGLLTTGIVPEDPFSNMEAREEIFKEYHSELVSTMLLKALAKAKVLYEQSEGLVQKFAQHLYFSEVYTDNGERVPLDDLPKETSLLYIQIENFANGLLGLEHTCNNPEEIYDELYALSYENAKRNHVSFEDASRWLERVENFEFKLTLQEATPPGKTILESAPILGTLRNMDPTLNAKVRYNEAPIFQPLYAIEDIGSLA